MHTPHGTIVIDLHGLSVPQAKLAVANMFRSAIEQNVAELFIITGRGNHINANGSRGVLKKLLPNLLKPYTEKITQVDAEAGAYKIHLKQDKTITQQLIALFSQASSFQRQIAELEVKAKQDDIEAMVKFACYCLSPLFENSDKIPVAIQMLEQAANTGSVEATIIIAELYISGIHVRRQPEKAFKSLKKIADKSLDAKFDLAKCYLTGEGVKTNDIEGAKLMKELADQNYPAACANLGRSYLTGDFTDSNPELGGKLLQRAAVQGYTYSYVDLARCYGSGHGLPKNEKLALHFYQLAAEINNSFALYQLGEYHTTGRAGLKSNPTEGFKYFLRAAELGDGDAQGRVAIYYLMGIGTSQKTETAIEWLNKACAQDHPEACYYMSVLLNAGKFIAKNESERIRCLTLAAKSKYPFAMVMHAIHVLEHPHKNDQRMKAFAQLKEASNLEVNLEAEQQMQIITGNKIYIPWIFFNILAKHSTQDNGYAATLLSLAVIYIVPNTEKRIVENNFPLAIVLAEHAAELNDVDAQFFLSQMYLGMLSDKIKDITLGLQWLEKAIKNNHPKALTLYSLLLSKKDFKNTDSSSKNPGFITHENVTTVSHNPINENKNSILPTPTKQITDKPMLFQYMAVAAIGVVAAVASAVFYQYKK